MLSLKEKCSYILSYSAANVDSAPKEADPYEQKE